MRPWAALATQPLKRIFQEGGQRESQSIPLVYAMPGTKLRLSCPEPALSPLATESRAQQASPAAKPMALTSAVCLGLCRGWRPEPWLGIVTWKGCPQNSGICLGTAQTCMPAPGCRLLLPSELPTGLDSTLVFDPEWDLLAVEISLDSAALPEEGSTTNEGRGTLESRDSSTPRGQKC